MTYRVLVVEDDSMWAQDLKSYVEEVLPDARVTVCSHYTDASNLLKNESWHLLVTDIQDLKGPKENGGQRDRSGTLLAQNALRKNIPTIVVSVAGYGAPEVDSLSQAVQIGGSAYFRSIDKQNFAFVHFSKAVQEAVGRSPGTEAVPQKARDRVFVCHGRNQKALEQLCVFLRYIGLEPSVFRDAAARMIDKSAVEIVRGGMREAQAVVVLFTPDELAELDGSLRHPSDRPHDHRRRQARPNVMFEAGIALGIDGASTQLVTMGEVELLSDLAGLQVVKLGNDHDSRRDLRERLLNLGCAVSERNLDFANLGHAGDFESCVR